MSAKELNKRIRIDPSAEDGDTHLTPLGESQAELLGKHWAPLLQAKAVAGDLRVFVSPMIRCCQTVEPLMIRLRRALPTFTAQLKMNLFELPGLVHNDDWAVFDEIDELVAKGTTEARTAVGGLLKAKSWKACGMTAKIARERFPWARTMADFPEDSPWYTQGFESPKRTAARIRGVVAELRELQFSLPEEAVVVFVSHGGTISELINHLLLGDDRTVSFEGIANTSVTCFHLPRIAGTIVSPLKSAFDPEIEINMLFMNRTEHLGMQRNIDFARSHLGAKI